LAPRSPSEHLHAFSHIETSERNFDSDRTLKIMTVLQSVIEVAYGFRVEAGIFLLAMCIHMVIFGRYRVRPAGGKSAGVWKESSAKQDKLQSRSCFENDGTMQSTPLFGTLLFTAKQLLREQASQETMASRLRDVFTETETDVLLSEVFQGLLEVLGKSANVELLGALRSVLKECGEQPSASFTEILMRGYLGRRMFKEFNELFEEVEAASAIKPVMFIFALRAAITSSNFELALARLQSIGKAGSLTHQPIVPNMPQHVLQQLCRLAAQENALPKLLGEFEQSKLLTSFLVNALRLPMDDLLLTSLLEACIRTSRTDMVRRILQQQPAFVSQVKNPHTFGVLIRAYSYLGSVQGAWSIWRDMRTRRLVPTSISIGCMVEALVSSGDPDAGYELIHEMLSDDQTRTQVNAVIYCSVLKGFCHQKRFDRVWDVHRELLAEKLEFSVVTYNALVDACARNGEMHRATPLLEAMAAQGIEPNLITYSTIIKGYCQELRLDRAFEVLEHMKSSKASRPDEITYNTLIDGCARHCLFDRGVALLEEMQVAGIPPTNFTLSVVVKLANRCKKLEQAFQLCDKVSQKYNIRLNVHVYANLVHACTNGRDMTRAFDVFREMVGEGVRPDQRTITLLVRGCLAARDAEGAVGLLRAALGLPGPWHPQLVGMSQGAIQPQGGLPHAFMVEALDAMATFGPGPNGGRALSEQLRMEWRCRSGGPAGRRSRP